MHSLNRMIEVQGSENNQNEGSVSGSSPVCLIPMKLQLRSEEQAIHTTTLQLAIAHRLSIQVRVEKTTFERQLPGSRCLVGNMHVAVVFHWLWRCKAGEFY